MRHDQIVSAYDKAAPAPGTEERIWRSIEQRLSEETEKASKKLVDAIDGLPTTLDGITKNAQNIVLDAIDINYIIS